MIPSYNDFILVWLLRKPCELSLYLEKRTPFAEVPSVKEEVTERDRRMRAMCVRYADDSERVGGEMGWTCGTVEGFKC